MFVAQVESIDAMELGRDSGIYQVVFKSSSVQVGTGFDTLRTLMDEHAPGASAGLERVDLGWRETLSAAHFEEIGRPHLIQALGTRRSGVR